MKKRKLFANAILLTATVLCLAGMISPAEAQSDGAYSLTWSTVDGGGGTNTGGAYSLNGTIGQPEAGAMSGGGYALVGGFWGGSPTKTKLFLPLLMR